ncbi:MAG: tRNA pseudouridine(54/55) synthase Pus10 [Euryarchaeota archaeon]|nr:tRNA pseudouridine(54/55) synthase Pus10 [Euryarchaeota archaeon]
MGLGPPPVSPSPAPQFLSEEGAASVASTLLARTERLCPECRGRALGRLGHGYSNPERLRAVSTELGVPLPTPLEHPEDCELCAGAFDRITRWVERCRAAAEGWEWATFRCGSRWDPERLAREEALWAEVGSSWGESVRTAFNRELGKALSSATGKPGNVDPPDLVFLADVPAGLASITVSPIFYYGRYRKLDRTLPQTRWPCRACHGKGCTRCEGTGKMYRESVEELVGGPLLSLAQGEGHAFHGMGREDIDARMLGRGRPFVLEISRPRKRTLPLEEGLRRISEGAQGRVEVEGLAPCTGGEVERVKAARPDKTYRVVVRPSVLEEKLNEVRLVLEGRPLEQRTPTRVAHRRADLRRLRTVKSVRYVTSDAESSTLEVRAEAGTYIKEFVDGDGGRTRPSLSELLGVALKVQALDVLEVHDGAEVA